MAHLFALSTLLLVAAIKNKPTILWRRRQGHVLSIVTNTVERTTTPWVIRPSKTTCKTCTDAVIVYKLRTTRLTSANVPNPWLPPGNNQWGFDGLYSDPGQRSPFAFRSDLLTTTPVFRRSQADVGSCLEDCAFLPHLLPTFPDILGLNSTWQYAGIVNGGYV